MSIVCPQCHYQRRPRDNAPAYECPKCKVAYIIARMNKERQEKERLIQTTGKGLSPGGSVRGHEGVTDIQRPTGKRSWAPGKWKTPLLWRVILVLSLTGALYLVFRDHLTRHLLKEETVWHIVTYPEVTPHLTLEAPCTPDRNTIYTPIERTFKDKRLRLYQCLIPRFKITLGHIRMRSNRAVDDNTPFIRLMENLGEELIQNHRGEWRIDFELIDMKEITFRNYPAFEGGTLYQVRQKKYHLQILGILDKNTLWFVMVNFRDEPNRREMSRRLFESVDISRKR
ncbi:MAG: hypothetical protein HQL52_07785 [Magnetococcales bacterium]|nr:hypothetical protein [Magnetococcales bacterium]